MNDPAGPPPRRLALPPIETIAACGLVCYATSFAVPFHYDDEVSIVHNPCLASPKDIASTLLGLGGTGCGGLARSVTALTFALNREVGGLEVWGYHAVNLAIHLCAALLLFLLVRETLALDERNRHDGFRAWAALLAALLFVVHPVQTQAVTYIAQRFASLAGLLALASLYGHLRAHLAETATARRGWTALTLAALALGLHTKQNFVVVPFALLLYDLVFLEGSSRARLGRVVPAAATLLLVPRILFGSAAAAGAGEVAGLLEQASRADSTMSRLDYLATELPIVARYLRLLVLPYGQTIEQPFVVHGSLFEPAVALSACLHAVLLALAGLAIVRGRRDVERWPLRMVGFGVAFFYLALSVESTVIPIADPIFEHRVYLPSAGIFMALVALASMAMRSVDRPRWSRMARPAFGAASLCVVALAGLTIARNRVWQSPVLLWAEAAKRSPRSARAHYNLANSRRDAGDLVGARTEWETTVALEPDHARALVQLGNVYMLAGEHERAEELYRRATTGRDKTAEAFYNLAVLLERRGAGAEACAAYREFVSSAPIFLGVEVEAVEATKLPLLCEKAR